VLATAVRAWRLLAVQADDLLPDDELSALQVYIGPAQTHGLAATEPGPG
jgi:hypothetical protein